MTNPKDLRNHDEFNFDDLYFGDAPSNPELEATRVFSYSPPLVNFGLSRPEKYSLEKRSKKDE